jgi:DNA-directed RNA polymerase specialized sigma24 family protein
VPLTTSTQSFPAEAAITAFLRGIERRAWVFARAQCGDEDLAVQAVAAALAEFRRSCVEKPLASWPRDFWTVLLAQPVLLRGQSLLLPELSVGPRAALLLRLVAGLDMGHAAQVLGVSEAAYRAALNHALQQLQAAGKDQLALEALRERLQQEIKLAAVPTLPLLVTDDAQAELDSDDAAAQLLSTSTSADEEVRSRWQLSLKIALGLLLLTLLVSFFWTPWHGLAPGESEPLPPEAIDTLAPADASATVTHPDFALLAAPADETVARDMAFYSWLAAGGQAASPPASAGSVQRAVSLPVQSPATPTTGGP